MTLRNRLRRLEEALTGRHGTTAGVNTSGPWTEAELGRLYGMMVSVKDQPREVQIALHHALVSMLFDRREAYLCGRPCPNPRTPWTEGQFKDVLAAKYGEAPVKVLGVDRLSVYIWLTKDEKKEAVAAWMRGEEWPASRRG